MLPENIIYIGVFINLLCTVWYLKDILQGSTKPNLISWVLWMLPPSIGVFLSLKTGGGLSALAISMAAFGPILVIIVSIIKKNAFWKIQYFDLICGFLSFLAIIFYVLTKNATLSIIFAILGDFLAYVPTFRKTWKYPETENSSTYIGGIINQIIAILIIKNWEFATYAFLFYLVLANSVEVFFIYRKKIKKVIFA